ncbi:MAG: hypothetical protein WCL16_10095, partial [bacterium]
MKTVSLAIEWRNESPKGRIEVINAEFGGGSVITGKAKWQNDRFTFSGSGACRIQFTVKKGQLGYGPHQSRVTVHNGARSFTFFVRDVTSAHPVLIALYGVMVVPATDRRSYDEVAAAVQSSGATSIQQRIDQEPEECYENACAGNRNETCPNWLGLSRDMRFFEVGCHPHSGFWGYVQPRFHSMLPALPELDHKPYLLNFAIGKGSACRHDMTRRLDEGYLPILHATQREEAITYNLTAFATLETSPLTVSGLRGSEWQACYPNTNGHMLKPEELEQLKDLVKQETVGREEETVLRIRITAVNSGATPCYTWFKTPFCQPATTNSTYDSAHGWSCFSSGRVYAVSRLSGKAAPSEEMAVLLQPGATVTLDILIPHQPVSKARAEKLAAANYEVQLADCRAFWKAKLHAGASISVPETAIAERIKAGLLHCDIAALGREPDGPVLATIGWYAPIGSESSPIIQFFDSMGWHKLAERCLEFFLERQRPDGFIQNFAGYQLETGPALWTMGEHFRYTRDIKWVRRIKPKLLKACDYLLAWRERNKQPA